MASGLLEFWGFRGVGGLQALGVQRFSALWCKDPAGAGFERFGLEVLEILRSRGLGCSIGVGKLQFSKTSGGPL